jgi:hypothetical protein
MLIEPRTRLEIRMRGPSELLKSSILALILLHGGPAFGQTAWQRYSGNPVIPGSAGGGYAFSPAVLFDSSANLYRMWFTAKEYGGAWAIYYAISDDGVTWFPYLSNPVLQSGSAYFESDGVVYCSVMRSGSVYTMYYAGVHGCCGIAIGLATSPDGIHWTKSDANPILVPSPAGWDSQYVSQPQVYFDGTTNYMYYEGTNGGRVQIGLATSTDGVNWTKAPSNPVLRNGPSGSWDESLTSPGGVFVDQGNYFMLFTGNGPSGPQRVGLATSHDGVSWAEHPGNPVFSGGGVASWDWSIRAGSVVRRDSTLGLWYSGDPVDDGGWSTGYATSMLLPLAVVTIASTTLELHQNTPNPFNQETSIGFDLPKHGVVAVRVFDTQGREVAELANEEMAPGPHRLVFRPDARGLSSGVYFCRLTEGGEVRSAKMFLLR